LEAEKSLSCIILSESVCIFIDRASEVANLLATGDIVRTEVTLGQTVGLGSSHVHSGGVLAEAIDSEGKKVLVIFRVALILNLPVVQLVRQQDQAGARPQQHDENACVDYEVAKEV